MPSVLIKRVASPDVLPFSVPSTIVKFRDREEPASDEGTDAPPDAIKIHLPDLRQGRNWSCGASVTMAVCEFFGVGPEDEEAYIEALGSDPEEGTAAHRIVEFAHRHGLNVNAREGMTIDELKADVDEGKPVIVLIQAWEDEDHEYSDTDDSDGHYIAVIGYDDEFIYAEDPSLKSTRGEIATDDFMARWHDSGQGDLDEGGHVFRQYGIALWKPEKVTEIE